MVESSPTGLARADRILDTAKDLLLRWGYRRVTVEELARRSGVGKGTVYLHWRTREEVFHAVGTREAAAMTEAVAGAIRADAGEVRLHRYMRRLFVEAMERPVLRAIFTRDADTLGTFLDNPARGPLNEAKLTASREYLGVLASEGLLREGLQPEDLDYSLPTVVFGFFGIEPLLPPDLELDLGQKADQLADVVRRAFEPSTAPSRRRLEQAAAKGAVILTQLAHEFRVTTYGADLVRRP